MGVNYHDHKGKYAARPQSAREYRESREPSIAFSICCVHSAAPVHGRWKQWDDGFVGDRFLPQGSKFWQKLKQSAGRPRTPAFLARGEDTSLLDGGEISEVSSLVSSVSSLSTVHSRSDEDEIHDYIHLLYGNVAPQDRLSNVLNDPEVVANYHRRRFHWGEKCARQFDLSRPYIMDMLRHMYERYDTVSCYSMGMIRVGMIIYYLEPYTLGLDQEDQGWGTAMVGVPRFEARVHLKGRFGIVVDKYAQHVKVAEVFTFGKTGLRSKPEKVWPEYVGLRAAEHRDWANPSPHKALEVGNSCCDIDPLSSVHLVTDKVSLSSQILFAGFITGDSHRRLKTMIEKIESR